MGILNRLTSALSDRYTIERELGRGGMAVVYLATDEKLGRKVAVKALSLTDEFQGEALQEAQERFRREAEAAAVAATKTEIGWGHQIRSYVLQPYQMVKDLRTGVQRSDPQTVLSGDIDAFLAASLAHKVSDKGAKAHADLD